MSLPPLPNNMTLELFDPSANRVVGYVFANSGSGSITQEQRWVLYVDYVSPPGRNVTLRKPTSTVLQFKSLDAFRNALHTGIGGIWKDGSRYVKVNAQTQSSIPSNPVPPPFPSMSLAESAEIPPDETPEASKTDEQIVNYPAIFQNAALRGYVYGTGITSGPQIGLTCNREYWITLPDYATPGDAGSASLEGRDNIAFESLDDFLRTMRGQWASGSSFTVVSCVYATGVPQDP